jgi:TonB family protein
MPLIGSEERMPMSRGLALAVAAFLPVIALAAGSGEGTDESGQADGGSGAADAGVPDAWKLPFNTESIHSVVESHQDEVKLCYESTLAEGADASGEVVVTFTVLPEGVVTKARVKSSTLRHRGIEACLLDALRHWYFPKPDRAQPVEFPFRFSEIGGKPKPAEAQPQKGKTRKTRAAK